MEDNFNKGHQSRDGKCDPKKGGAHRNPHEKPDQRTTGGHKPEDREGQHNKGPHNKDQRGDKKGWDTRR